MYLNIGERTIRKYENIKFIKQKSAKRKICKLCGLFEVLTRAGYCFECKSSGKSKKEQGKKLATLYKGANNPNYIDGKSALRAKFRQTNEYKKFRNSFNKICDLSGLTNDIDLHHIIPVGICEKLKYDKRNVIMLNKKYHYYVHLYKLDTKWLTEIKDLDKLKEWYLDKIKYLLDEQDVDVNSIDILKIVSRNYSKTETNFNLDIS